MDEKSITQKIGRLQITISYKNKKCVLVIKNESGNDLANFICTDTEFLRLSLFLLQENLQRYELVE